MPGFIDNSTGDAAFDAYSQGRAIGAANLENLSNFAQWSALMDDKTCDWCAWADLRIFDTTIEPYYPPMHHGCRCIVAYITKDEFPPTPDWGDGPPPGSWPPGTTNGTSSGGTPSLAKEGQNWGSNISLIDIDEAVKDALAVKDKLESGGAATRQNFNRDQVEKFLGPAYKDDIQRVVNDIYRQWADESHDLLRNIVESMERGVLPSPDARTYLEDIAKGINVRLDKDFYRDTLLHWQANSEVSKTTARALFGDEVTLYRGISVKLNATSGWANDIFGAVSAGDVEFSVGTHFAESWSTRYKVASRFAEISKKGIVFKKTVRTDDMMFGWWDNGQLLSTEFEAVWANWDSTIVPKLIKEIDAEDLVYKQGPYPGKYYEVELW